MFRRAHDSAFIECTPEILRSADGAFNAALLLERGDPLSAIGSAAGVPMFLQEDRCRAPPPSHIPFRKHCNTPDPPRPAPVGGGGGGTRKTTNVADRDALDPSPANFGDETTTAEGAQRIDDDLGEHVGVAQENLRRPEITDGEQSRSDRQQDEKRVQIDDNQKIRGSRSLALTMFQRAAELGHAGAIGEVQRLRLRERMDSLARSENRSPGRREARR